MILLRGPSLVPYVHRKETKIAFIKKGRGGGEPIRYVISIYYPIEHWIRTYALIREDWNALIREDWKTNNYCFIINEYLIYCLY